jgi:hypothetical protein
MSDEDAYMGARGAAIAIRCAFERALLSRCVNCSRANRLLLAEREAVSCTDGAAGSGCREFLSALRRNALFALRIPPVQPWPFGKEIRLQCGGVLGLRAAMGQEEATSPDVAGLVAQGLARYGDIEQFPYSAIMRGVVHYQPRRRKRPRE